MGELMSESKSVDIVTLAEQLQRNKELSVIGGVAYLAGLTEGLPRRLSIEDYVRIVKDKSLLRQTIAESDRVGTLAGKSGSRRRFWPKQNLPSAELPARPSPLA